MSDVKSRYSVRSRSTDVPGRTLNQARANHWVIDSPSGPNEAVTTGESFMAGIAACGVTLIELHAQQKGLPFGSLEVQIEGVRTEASMPDFATIDLQFQFAGISQEQAAYYVDVWKKH
ncbi:MAG: OsmC family protein [Chloroflexi bacterium]|nr:OsmC family protein [Chloroflexota bacterium]